MRSRASGHTAGGASGSACAEGVNSLAPSGRIGQHQGVSDTVRLLPDPDQHDLLRSTLQRVNRACNAARSAALEQHVDSGNPLRTVVKEATERFKLPAGLNASVLDRVQESLTGPPGRRQRFGDYQSLIFPASTLKWAATDRVTLPTSAGRRTIRVYVDATQGGLRPPLEGRAATLVFRNNEFELVGA